MKITNEEVKKIRNAYKAGTTTEELARKYSVTPRAIQYIVFNRSYTDKSYSPPEARLPVRKITLAVAKKIRKEKGTAEEVASKYGLSARTYYNIMANERWIDPKYTPPARAIVLGRPVDSLTVKANEYAKVLESEGYDTEHAREVAFAAYELAPDPLRKEPVLTREWRHSILQLTLDRNAREDYHEPDIDSTVL